MLEVKFGVKDHYTQHRAQPEGAMKKSSGSTDEITFQLSLAQLEFWLNMARKANKPLAFMVISDRG